MAFSTVKERAQMRVVGFNAKKLIPPPQVVLDFFKYVQNLETDEANKCCNHLEHFQMTTGLN